MAENLRKPYSFSFFTALWISLISTIGLAVLEWIFFEINWVSLLIFAGFVFFFAFLIAQARTELLVYKRIKQLYKDISFLEGSTLSEDQVTTDIKALTRDVERFAETKKLEIEALKIRENYRREFLGNISHELKTPLFTIQGYILTLLDGAMEDKDKFENYLLRTEKSVERLIYIVQDLEMITRLEAGELTLDSKNFNLVSVIHAVFELLEMKASEKKISLTYDEVKKSPVWVRGDKERIQQVVTNLVANSIKYGKHKGTTEIRIEELTSEKYMVRITDNGEGFKKEDIPRIFERFYRVDKSGSREEGGSGLGLSIVKHILEAHNEKIYVESDYGTGSEFSFTISKGKKA